MMDRPDQKLESGSKVFEQIVTSQFTPMNINENQAELPPNANLTPLERLSELAEKKGQDAALPIAADPSGSTKQYRIDSESSRFEPGGLLSEPRLHLSVKAKPDVGTLDVEEMIRGQKAMRFSQGSESQQIVVSAYEAIDTLDDLTESPYSGGQFLPGIELNLLPHGKAGEIASLSDAAVENVQVTSVPVESGESSLRQEIRQDVNQHPVAISQAGEEVTTTEKSEIDAGPVAQENQQPSSPKDENAGKLSAAITSNPGTIQQLRASQTGATVIETQPVAQEAIEHLEIKPAWEVVSFRWPATIQKLCGNHESAFSRLFDSLKQNSRQPLRRVGVIHAVPGQGSTTLATCLANVLAKQGNNTLLADFDLDSPALEEVANIQLRKGWQQLLESEDSINEYLVRESANQLTLMPLQAENALVHQRSRLLAKLRELSNHLNREYDVCIFDVGNVQNLMIEENCHVGFLDGVVIVSGSGPNESQAIAMYEKLIAAGVPSVVIAENFRSPAQSAA